MIAKLKAAAMNANFRLSLTYIMSNPSRLAGRWQADHHDDRAIGL